MGNVESADLLVDSHILYWLDADPGRVSARLRAVLRDRKRNVFVSAASAWELGIKRAKGKLKFEGSVASMRSRYYFLERPITFAHSEKAAELPLLHGDPFDRLLVAQAMLEGLTLVTVDPMMARYGVAVLV